MDELLRGVLVAAVVAGAHLLEGITGFGSAVIALPFLAMLLGIKVAVPLLCFLGWPMALYLTLRSYRSIRWREFLFIAVYAGIGIPFGILLFDRMAPAALTLLLGVVMIGVGAHGFRSAAKVPGSPVPAAAPRRSLPMRLLLVAGGVIHGAFGTGGPFIVIYASRALPEKSLFRVTLSLLWLTLNSFRIGDWLVRDPSLLTPELGRTVLFSLPFMAIGLLAGDRLHRRVDERRFRRIVYATLAAAGLVMTGNSLAALL